MIGKLSVVDGPDKGRAFTVKPGKPLLIGRGQNTDTKLTDLGVSRLHCQIEVEGDQVVVSDSGSSAGTLINGHHVGRHALLDCQIIRIGGTSLLFERSSVHEESTLPQPRVSGPRLTPDTASELAELTGETLLHYEVGRLLAQGRSSLVFLGKDTRNGKPVALKVLGSEYARIEEEVQRFIRAVESTYQLRHPNIVRIYAAGKSHGRLWIAMEYVEGESLARVIERIKLRRFTAQGAPDEGESLERVIERIGTLGMVEWSFALRVGHQIAQALEAAYDKQIIHRNIKPENILIRQIDNVAKLGDLILAKSLAETTAHQITRPGDLVGDLMYMSPERTSSESAVDTRSDIYSLGATLYQLLTGHPPFEYGSRVDLVGKIRTEIPVRPKKHQLAVPDLFEGTIMRMLAKRPEDRFQTPGDLVRDLERAAKYNGLTL